MNSLPEPIPSLVAETLPPCFSGELANDRQSDAQAPLAPVQRFVDLGEQLENWPWQHLLGNANAGVPDLEHRVPIVGMSAVNRKLSFFGRVLRGIAQQIDQNLLQLRTGSTNSGIGSSEMLTTSACRRSSIAGWAVATARRMKVAPSVGSFCNSILSRVTA